MSCRKERKQAKLFRNINSKKASFSLKAVLLFAAGLASAACSFDYSPGKESEKNKPDIIMENIEYVRVRGGDPQVRFQAEYAERWEDRQLMELKNFVFEQMEDHGDTVNAEGRAASAVVQLSSNDLTLNDGVRINIESEDIIIRTATLEWKDKDKHLYGGEGDVVEIQRSDGTSFLGRGFSADARNRTWNFSGKVEGTYVEKEDEEEPDENSVKIEWIRNEPGYLLPETEYYTPERYTQEQYTQDQYTPEEKAIIKTIMPEEK